MVGLHHLSLDKAETHTQTLEQLEECHPVSTLVVGNPVVDSTTLQASAMAAEVDSASVTPNRYSANSYAGKAAWEAEKALMTSSLKCRVPLHPADARAQPDSAAERNLLVDKGHRHRR